MAQKDLLGYRQTVFSRPFEGAEWLMQLSIKEDDFIFLATDENYTTIYPQEVRKLDDGNLSVKFPVSVKGYASVFRLTPLLNFQIQSVVNENYVQFYHKYYIPYFIVQTWNSDGYLVLPKTIKKDLKQCIVEFHDNFTGNIYCIFITDGVKNFINENSWVYKHKKQISRGSILVQSDDPNREVIIPSEEKRYGDNSAFSTSNYIQVDWNSEQTGELVSIIRGYRI
jgi:hypothetical protein